MITFLTPQEERVLRFRARGMSSSECAHALGISEQTIKNHLTHVYRKLDTSNLAETLGRVGWLSVPGEPVKMVDQCEFVGRCGRVIEHRGGHGGFRPLPEEVTDDGNRPQNHRLQGS